MRSFILLGILAAFLGSCSGMVLDGAARDHQDQAAAGLATRTAIDAERAAIGLPPLSR